MTTDRIKALVDLGPELQKRYDSRSVMNPTGSILLTYEEAPVILAAIEALKPMAAGGSVVVPVEPTEAICEKLRAVLPELFDTSDDTLREIYTDILAAASPSASTGKDGVVERVARAIAKVIGDDDWEKANYFINTADDTIQTTQDLYRDIARAALAAIGER